MNRPNYDRMRPLVMAILRVSLAVHGMRDLRPARARLKHSRGFQHARAEAIYVAVVGANLQRSVTAHALGIERSTVSGICRDIEDARDDSAVEARIVQIGAALGIDV
jgi:hypothetical protein